jgi:multicomponent Na+:H+ antiporter subunit D
MYTLGGGAALLVGIGWLHAVAGRSSSPTAARWRHRTPAGTGAGDLRAADRRARRQGGAGAAARLAAEAMVAPAPVSALLHAVAVVKAGAFGIVRVVYDVYGVEFASGARRAVAARLAAAYHHHLRLAARARAGRSEAAPGVLPP